MDFTVPLTAVALAMDCLAVSIAGGLTKSKPRMNDVFRVAASFGSFQSIMALLGWFAGSSFMEVISGVDHWVAFVLLISIGTKMIYGSTNKEKNPLSFDAYSLLMLSLATSIDALAAGLCLTILGESVASSVIMIGTVSFILSLTGFYAGKRLGRLIGNKAEIAGGLILIAIGLKTLLEHL